MPAGLLVTVPEPNRVTVSCVGAEAKVAVTAAAAESVIVHAPVPLHAPPQPEKIEPAAGVSVSVTCVFCANTATHVDGQLMPAGLLVTVPLPETVTLSCGIADCVKLA